MPVDVDGVMYYFAADIMSQVGVSRQTLWRWRQDGKIPSGYRYRDRHIVFSADEFQAICKYAHRLEPAGVVAPQQLRLFDGPSRHKEETR
jgi:predicted DNA-binding transcriptional regulator AlpA